MSTCKSIDTICCVILILTIILASVGMGVGAFNDLGNVSLGYEAKLFNDTTVHTLNVIMPDWDNFISTCENEEYSSCSVIIDNESFKNVGIRAKGNTSLSSVSKHGNNRYSFKLEFDHYSDNMSYYGLDKLSLNNIIQDNTYMKDYLVYTLMRENGVAAPLCSFVNILINGESFGLYLAVEGIEESFLNRNYDNTQGELYKPDSMQMGGGRGNGKKISQSDFENTNLETIPNSITQGTAENVVSSSATPDNRFNNQTQKPPQKSDFSEDINKEFSENFNPEDIGSFADNGAFGGRGNSSSDVLLKYTDDNFSSYENIFENAKTDITDSDKTRLINAIKQLNEDTDVSSCVDVEAVIRYFVVHNFVLNFDSYTGQMIHNYYLYEDNGKLSMLPWDYNLAFGGFMSMGSAENLINFPIDSPVSGGNTEDRPMIAWIFQDEEYISLYHKIMSEFIIEIFDSNWFNEKFDSVFQMIKPYVESDTSSFCTYDEFLKGAETLKDFCLLRAESVKGQLNGTISSTSEGQTKDNSNFITADDININDMGSMGQSMGDKGDLNHEHRGEANFNNNEILTGEFNANNIPPQQNGDMTTPPEKFQGFGGEPPERPNGNPPQFNDSFNQEDFGNYNN